MMLLSISVRNFVDSLPIMGKGMLSIFIVTAVLIGCVYLLNTLFKTKK